MRVRLEFSDDMWMERRDFIETVVGATGAGALTAMFGSDALGAVEMAAQRSITPLKKVKSHSKCYGHWI